MKWRVFRRRKGFVYVVNVTVIVLCKSRSRIWFNKSKMTIIVNSVGYPTLKLFFGVNFKTLFDPTFGFF